MTQTDASDFIICSMLCYSNNNYCIGCEESRLRAADCSLSVDGRHLTSCRQDSMLSPSVPLATELQPSDPRLVVNRPAVLRQSTDVVQHGSLLPSAPTTYCSTGSFYYAANPLVDLFGSCQQRASTFCRGVGGGLTSGSDEDDDDVGHVASSEEEESKPRIWSLADVATSCRGTIRAGNGSTSSCMTGTGGHAQNGGSSFLPWSNSGYYAAAHTGAAGSSTLYPSYYHTAAAAAAAVQQRPPPATAGTSFRASEMLADSAARHHLHQALPQDQAYAERPQQQQHRLVTLSRSSSFSPGPCTQQQPAAPSSSAQFSDVIGFCAPAGLT